MMRNAYVFHRYRKWRRKALRNPTKVNLMMKWRYWHRLFGDHVNLWDVA